MLTASITRVLGNLDKHRAMLSALTKERIAQQELAGDEVLTILQEHT
jgi:hypothetical protein